MASAPRAAAESPHVRAERDGRIGRIALDRPQALNAVDLPMIEAIQAALDAWADDPSVHAVVIEGAGGRAFCAGGDIRAIRAFALAGDTAAVEAFFAAEFALNLAIARYPKPYIALIDGVCMGGGIGLSVHGAVRVTTEAGLFAMPETAIGYFPDVGTSHVLPRLPGALGFYLGLTGTRLQGADAVWAGFATHFVPRERLAELSGALAADGPAALAGFSAELPPFGLAEDRAAIDRCFGAPDVAGIRARLAGQKGDWAAETGRLMDRLSPSSLVWSHAILRHGALCILAACLEAELALTRAVCRHHDFLEGVRAMVVDKDRAPRWRPPSLEDVEPAEIAALLAPAGIVLPPASVVVSGD